MALHLDKVMMRVFFGVRVTTGLEAATEVYAALKMISHAPVAATVQRLGAAGLGSISEHASLVGVCALLLVVSRSFAFSIGEMPSPTFHRLASTAVLGAYADWLAVHPSIGSRAYSGIGVGRVRAWSRSCAHQDGRTYDGGLRDA